MSNEKPTAYSKAAFTIAEAAAQTSIGRTTLYAKLKTGELRARKCGRKTLILAQDIQNFLDGLTVIRSPSSSDKRSRRGEK